MGIIFKKITKRTIEKSAKIDRSPYKLEKIQEKPGHISLFCSQNMSSKHFENSQRNLPKYNNKKIKRKKQKVRIKTQIDTEKNTSESKEYLFQKFFLKKKIYPKIITKSIIEKNIATNNEESNYTNDFDIKNTALRTITPEKIGNFKRKSKYININSVFKNNVIDGVSNSRSKTLPQIKNNKKNIRKNFIKNKILRKSKSIDFKTSYLKKYNNKRKKLKNDQNIFCKTSSLNRIIEFNSKKNKKKGLIQENGFTKNKNKKDFKIPGIKNTQVISKTQKKE